MKPFKILNIRGTILDKSQLENYLEKLASEHVLKNKSDKDTNPIYRLKDNFKYITEVYNILNNHLKLGITIHPAGEWLLDNHYIIEETVRNIENDLKEDKYVNFVGIENVAYKGFARIYELARRDCSIYRIQYKCRNYRALFIKLSKKETIKYGRDMEHWCFFTNSLY